MVVLARVAVGAIGRLRSRSRTIGSGSLVLPLEDCSIVIKEMEIMRVWHLVCLDYVSLPFCFLFPLLHPNTTTRISTVSTVSPHCQVLKF